MKGPKQNFKNPDTIAMLVDFTKCVGCDECWIACEKENEWQRPEKTTVTDADGKTKEVDCAGELRPVELDHNVFTTLMTYGDDRDSDVKMEELPDGLDVFGVRRFCMHCIDPACVSVCPSRAMRKDGDGPVYYYPDICLGCRYCMVACPFGIPKYEYHRWNPRIRKCFMCNHRTVGIRDSLTGKVIKEPAPRWTDCEEEHLNWPACAAACVESNGEEDAATRFFPNRNDAIKEARRRLAEDEDGIYMQHIYGEKEYGGTGILMLTSKSIPFENIPGFIKPLFPDNYGNYLKQEKRLPEYTGLILGALPSAVAMTAAFLGGFWWFCTRREKVQSEESGSKH